MVEMLSVFILLVRERYNKESLQLATEFAMNN